MAYGRINVTEAKALMDEGAVVVDIRDPQSFAAGAIPGAVHLSVGMIDNFLATHDVACPLIVCCYHGNNSQGAAHFFSEKGIEKAYSLDGGYEAWSELAEAY
jgi:thiosulfate sulfurtransferase